MQRLVRKGTAPSRHVYDVIVVGGQLGGILSTALFARRGLQVLHVPHDGLREPYVHGDAKLPHAPFLMPPIKSVPAFDEVLQELGLATTIARAHPAGAPAAPRAGPLVRAQPRREAPWPRAGARVREPRPRASTT